MYIHYLPLLNGKLSSFFWPHITSVEQKPGKCCLNRSKIQRSKTDWENIAIRCIVVRGTDVSQHHGGEIKGNPETPVLHSTPVLRGLRGPLFGILICRETLVSQRTMRLIDVVFPICALYTRSWIVSKNTGKLCIFLLYVKCSETYAITILIFFFNETLI